MKDIVLRKKQFSATSKIVGQTRHSRLGKQLLLAKKTLNSKPGGGIKDAIQRDLQLV